MGQGTGSKSTPVRFVLEERLARMPAQEMVVHLLFVKLNLADGLWLVLFHGVLDVLLSYLVSMSEFHTLKIGSMPIRRQIRITELIKIFSIMYINACSDSSL